MAPHAFPLNIKQIKDFTWAIGGRGCEKQFKEGGPTEKWWRGFKKRHPDLSLRTSDSLDRRQSRMANKNVVKSHFNVLKKKKHCKKTACLTMYKRFLMWMKVA